MSLHAARVAPEKLTPHQPADVQFVRISNEVDMKVERIPLDNIKDRFDRYIRAWIDATKEDPTVTLSPYDGRNIGSYRMSTIIEAAVKSNNEFIMTDGFDGSQDIHIPIEEIRKLARDMMAALPAYVGVFEIKVQFKPCDHSLPF